MMMQVVEVVVEEMEVVEEKGTWVGPVGPWGVVQDEHGGEVGADRRQVLGEEVSIGISTIIGVSISTNIGTIISTLV